MTHVRLRAAGVELGDERDSVSVHPMLETGTPFSSAPMVLLKTAPRGDDAVAVRDLLPEITLVLCLGPDDRRWWWRALERTWPLPNAVDRDVVGKRKVGDFLAASPARVQISTSLLNDSDGRSRRNGRSMRETSR